MGYVEYKIIFFMLFVTNWEFIVTTEINCSVFKEYIIMKPAPNAAFGSFSHEIFD